MVANSGEWQLMVNSGEWLMMVHSGGWLVMISGELLMTVNDGL